MPRLVTSMARPPLAAITMATHTTPRGVPLPVAVWAETSTVRLVGTMTTRDPTAQEVGHPEIRVPLVQDTLPLGPAGGRAVLGVPVPEEVVTVETTVPQGEVDMTVIKLEVHRRVTTATLSRETDMVLVPAAEEEGGTIPVPHPKPQGATPLIKAPDDIPPLELPRGAPTEVGVPLENIQTPLRVEATGEPQTTMEEARVPVRANLDQSLPVMTATDHH
jgi:hypothetical protein